VVSSGGSFRLLRGNIGITERRAHSIPSDYVGYGLDCTVDSGGIDMNFLTVASPEEVYARSRAMLERTAGRGNYMLGSGNSIPEFVPVENYLAMIRAALDADKA